MIILTGFFCTCFKSDTKIIISLFLPSLSLNPGYTRYFLLLSFIHGSFDEMHLLTELHFFISLSEPIKMLWKPFLHFYSIQLWRKRRGGSVIELNYIFFISFWTSLKGHKCIFYSDIATWWHYLEFCGS